MGTLATLATYDDDRTRALERLDALVVSLEATEAELSTWRDGTPLGTLNRTAAGVPSPLSASLCRLFRALDHWHHETGGAFDPAIGSLVQAYGLRAEGRVPTGRELTEARTQAGWRLVDLDPERCRFRRHADVQIDEGGFGKGEALDRLKTIAPDSAWIVDLGGHVLVNHLRPAGGAGWKVALAHPDARDEVAFELELASGSLSTSGGSERDRTAQETRISHILDPRSMAPATFDGSVTVWHEQALVADILSTALFVMGPDEGLSWADARGLAVCFLDTEAGGSPRIRASVAWTHRFS
jgi:thiamine biosynthesis lipoprotein